MKRMVVVFAVVGFLVTSGWAATPEQVAESIRKGREWLLAQQNASGNWERSPSPTATDQHGTEGGQWGGITALATYALLAAGEPASNPKMQSAIQFLRNAPIKGVYALGMRAQVWQLLPKDDWVMTCIDRDVKLLLDGVLQQPDNTGLYNYLTPAKPDDKRVDHSVSQYGVLGMWALQKAGGNVPIEYWQYVERIWEAHQDVTGGWCYGRIAADGHPINMSMTAAGVATLFITLDYLHSDEGVQPRGNISRPTLEAGMDWMTKNFDTTREDYYAWYGIERIGVASGRKYFGPHDWYRKGSDIMVQRQTPEGRWSGGRGDVVSTSFCLIFLSRGRAPLMMSKLQYEVLDAKGNKGEGLWNQRPRDVANIARWVGQRIERDLNWQVVNLDAPVEELVESPILYLSGSAPLNLSDEHKAKLRSFIEHGGMVVGNPDGGRPMFTDSFKKLGESLFPAYKFRELPEKHPIYTNQQFQRSRWRVKPPVQALGNGAREFMIVIPQIDVARQWQIMDMKREEHFQLPANIFLYATDKTVQFKGERKIAQANPGLTPERTITVARLEYDGNWNPEPAAWDQLRANLLNSRRVDVKVENVKLGASALAATHRVAHLTGTAKITLTPEQREELKKYVEAGGVLVVDAAGGSGEFRTAIEEELSQIFPEGAKAFASTLKPDNALYTALGSAASNVEYRLFTRAELGSLPKEPRIRGYEIGGKYRVIYSPEDMTVGLVGQPVDGIMGYSPKSAAELMGALLMYAAN